MNPIYNILKRTASNMDAASAEHVRKTHRWKVRHKLVEHLQCTLMPTRRVDDDRLVERLTDLSRSGSWLASEARAAIHETTDAQWRRLRKDVCR